MRRKHASLWIGALLSVLIVFAWFALVQAQGVVVGVADGNMFEYRMLSVTGNGTEFSPGASNFTVDVYLVTGSLVRFQEDIRYQNSTESILTGSTDLSNGSSEGGLSWIITPANLEAGNPVYSTWNWIINGTVIVDGRETNYLSVKNAYLNNSGQDVDVNATLYCDQATGAVVNATVSVRSLSNSFQFAESYKLIGENLDWTSTPEFSPIVLEATMAILTACAAVAGNRHAKLRHLKRKLA